MCKRYYHKCTQKEVVYVMLYTCPAFETEVLYPFYYGCTLKNLKK